MRFDREEEVCNGRFGDTWPSFGEMYRNVVWKTAGITLFGIVVNAPLTLLTMYVCDIRNLCALNFSSDFPLTFMHNSMWLSCTLVNAFSGVEVKGGNHIISRNTIFATGSDGPSVPLHGTLQTPALDDNGRDVSTVFDIVLDNGALNQTGWCKCGEGHCAMTPDLCCVPVLPQTYEGFGNTFVGNAMERFYGAVGGGTWGTIRVASTEAVDAKFASIGRDLSLRVARNSAGVLLQELKDAGSLDFRPNAESTMFANVGIGAYDAQTTNAIYEYWIPGRQEYRASRPLPEHQASGVAINFDLKFLPGR